MEAFIVALSSVWADSGFSALTSGHVIMICVGLVLLYMAIGKGFEPLLLSPIAFGCILANIPKNGFEEPGVMSVIMYGIHHEVFPPLIFLGVGAMTDFGPLLANPKTLLLGAAAQGGIFFTFIGAALFGMSAAECGSIAIIGGADGPTSIYVSSRLLTSNSNIGVGTIALAAYTYMALVPIIQPPIMKALTTKKERSVVMGQLRPVSKVEKLIFPILVTIVISLMVPSAAPLVGMLMFGNLLKESGVCDRLVKTAQNELMNIITIFLGVTVGATTQADKIMNIQFAEVMALGVVAFSLGTACGVLLGKLMYVLSGHKINPLIGSAGVSAVPMAARISQKVGQQEVPTNYLLMHAMGPNVAGVIGSAVAAGVLLTIVR